jgi:hypothetical protein
LFNRLLERVHLLYMSTKCHAETGSRIVTEGFAAYRAACHIVALDQTRGKGLTSHRGFAFRAHEHASVLARAVIADHSTGSDTLLPTAETA